MLGGYFVHWMHQIDALPIIIYLLKKALPPTKRKVYSKLINGSYHRFCSLMKNENGYAVTFYNNICKLFKREIWTSSSSESN